jgi:hypothetical protein
MKNSVNRLRILFLAVMLTPIVASSQVNHLQAPFDTHLAQAPGYYRIKVGNFQVTALSDGVAEGPVAQLFVGAEPGEVEEILSMLLKCSSLIHFQP